MKRCREKFYRQKINIRKFFPTNNQLFENTDEATRPITNKLLDNWGNLFKNHRELPPKEFQFSIGKQWKNLIDCSEGDRKFNNNSPTYCSEGDLKVNNNSPTDRSEVDRKINNNSPTDCWEGDRKVKNNSPTDNSELDCKLNNNSPTICSEGYREVNNNSPTDRSEVDRKVKNNAPTDQTEVDRKVNKNSPTDQIEGIKHFCPIETNIYPQRDQVGASSRQNNNLSSSMDWEVDNDNDEYYVPIQTR